MSHLISLRKLGLIEFPTGFRLEEAPTKPKAPAKKKPLPMKKMQNASIAAPTIMLVPKAVTVQSKKNARVSSAPTSSSPRRTKSPLPTATEHEGTSFHSIHNNTFQKQHTPHPHQRLPLSSSIIAAPFTSSMPLILTDVVVEQAPSITASMTPWVMRTACASLY
jgi:hypothetical protein